MIQMIQTKIWVTIEMVLLHYNALMHWSLHVQEKSLCMMMWCHCTFLIMNHMISTRECTGKAACTAKSKKAWNVVLPQPVHSPDLKYAIFIYLLGQRID
jgi:hypothetical protein